MGQSLQSRVYSPPSWASFGSQKKKEKKTRWNCNLFSPYTLSKDCTNLEDGPWLIPILFTHPTLALSATNLRKLHIELFLTNAKVLPFLSRPSCECEARASTIRRWRAKSIIGCNLFQLRQPLDENQDRYKACSTIVPIQSGCYGCYFEICITCRRLIFKFPQRALEPHFNKFDILSFLPLD